jgi:hypothetical protein
MGDGSGESPGGGAYVNGEGGGMARFCLVGAVLELVELFMSLLMLTFLLGLGS